MTAVPVSWLSYSDDNMPRGRWDQYFLERIFDGDVWRVPGGFTFETIPWDPDDGQGRVIVFPCGHYVEVGERHIAAAKLRADLHKLPWAVVIATSDESDSFEWNKFDLPSHVKLWVQTPRPESTYPEGTFFHPLGSPTSAKEWGGPHDKNIDVFFAGQVNHVRREGCVTALTQLKADFPDLNVQVVPTKGFTLGLPLAEYQDRMRATRVVPCPAGICSQESFRVYEALEAGAIPLADQYRPDLTGDGFWSMLGVPVGGLVGSWAGLPHQVERLLNDPFYAPSILAEWQQYKRSLVYRLHDDVWSVMRDWESTGVGFGPGCPGDEITVVVVTSPTPSHPSTEIIEETIASVKERLPGAEIHILIDGVRDEQKDRTADYYEYARRLCGLYNADPNIVPYVHAEHLHQAVMFRHALNRIKTPYVMFVEHDTPLVGDVDFDDLLFVMNRDEICLMRFHHDVGIHETSAHLYLETEGTDELPYLRTVQWSQRPHVARTDWYRDLVAAYFGWESRTMIEDTMHGAVQHLHNGSRTAVRKGWNKWKLAVWAPPGDNIKFSTHLDGRGDDQKYPMKFAYDSARPEGAPTEGTR